MKARLERLRDNCVERTKEVTTFLHSSWLRLRINSQRRGDFYELLGHFVADGLPLFEALTEIDQQYQRSGEPMQLISRAALIRMRGEHGRAYTFGHALDGYVPVVEAIAVSSGEDAGNPAEGLYRAAEVCRSNGKIVATIRQELAYPVFLFLVFSLLMIGISEHVIPMFEAVLPMAKWPAIAQNMARVAHATPWILTLITLLLVIVLGSYFLQRSKWTGPRRDWFDQHMLPWNLHRRVTGALLLAAMSTLIRIGIPFSQVLERLAAASGPWEALHLMRVRNRLRRGMREGEAMSTELFDVQMRWQISLYGRMTRFSDGLAKLAERLVEDTQKSIRRSFAVLRGVLMLLIAALIAWIYMAFLAITMAAKATA